MAQIVRLGDTSSHGGSMISAGGGFKVNGKIVCVHGDSHSCPIPYHGVTSVNSSTSLKTNGKPVTRTGDTAGCGAVITQGSSDTFTK